MAKYQAYKFTDNEREVFKETSVNLLPDQLAPRTPQWYFRNAQYILSFYNTNTNNVSYPYTSGLVGDTDDTANNSTSGRTNENGGFNFYDQPVNKMLYYLLYYLGEQPNLNYNYLTPSVTGENTVFWTKGKDIRVGIDNMRGTAQQALTSLKFGANPLSAEVVSKREKMYHQEMFKFLVQPILKNILNNAVKTPAAQEDFKTPESIKDWMDSKFKEHLADVYINIAKNNWQSQYWVEDGVNIFTYASVCGLVGVEHFMDNGYYKKMVHAPYNLIFDNRVDNDFNRYGRFVGAIQQMTLAQVYSRYNDWLTEEDRKDLSEIASSREKMTAMNQGPVSFPWWNLNSDNNNLNKDTAFNVVRVYFIATENIEGNEVQELYSAEIIGNRYMVNFGKVNNVITDVNTPYTPMLPIQLWMPNMIMGRLNSFVSRVCDLQDEYDLYRFKIRELVANSKGKKFIIFGDKINGTTVKQMVEDWENCPITLVSSTGTYANSADNGAKLEVVDLTLDPNIIQLINVREKVNQELLSYMSQSAATLGRQTKYMGQKSYEGNVDQANKGNAVFFDDFMNFVQRNIRYGMNMKKNLYADGQLQDEAQTVIGERGLKMLKMTKDLYAEDFLIYLQLDDSIDQGMKDKIFQLVTAYANNSNDPYKLTHLIKLMTMKTSSEMKDKVEAWDEEIQERSKEEMMANLQAKQSELKANNDIKLSIAQIAAQVKDGGQKLNFLAKKMKLDKDMQSEFPEQLPAVNTVNQQQIPAPAQQQPNSPQ